MHHRLNESSEVGSYILDTSRYTVGNISPTTGQEGGFEAAADGAITAGQGGQ